MTVPLALTRGYMPSSDPQHNWSYSSGAVSAPSAEPDAGKSEPTASVLTVPVTSYPSSPESQGA